ncbi:MAG: ATP-binding protein [Thermodesulfobacteriota bacterium]
MDHLDLAPYIAAVRPISAAMDMHEVFARFRSDKTSSFFPVVDLTGRPLGIVRELELKDYAYGMFGRELIKRESVTAFVRGCLTVEYQTPIDEILIRLGSQPLSDGILITRNGIYAGVVSNLSLLALYEQVRIRMQSQLSQVQKMEAIGTLAGGIAHDFNNILLPIMGYAELIKKLLGVEQPAIVGYVDQILTASKRAKELVRQILTFSRQRSSERVPISLAPVVREVMQLLRSSLPATITIATEVLIEEATVVIDPAEVHQILMNLCTNAAHAMRGGGGRLTVSLREASGPMVDHDGGALLQERPCVRVSVQDTGHGIEPAHLARIFEPFFTTKGPGEGTGMGLSVVHGIVTGCGGGVRVESAPGQGSTFHIYLPLSRRMTDHPALVTSGRPTHGGGIRVLLVDDEHMITELASAYLAEVGFRVTVKSSSLEALVHLRARPGDFDVLVTDQTMPELTGIKLAQRALEVRPDLPIILVTGYSDMVSEDVARACGVREYMLKPYTFGLLASKVVALAGSDGAKGGAAVAGARC